MALLTGQEAEGNCWTDFCFLLKNCHSVPLFLNNKFLQESVDSHVEYHALKINFLNEITNSENCAEPCLLARALEDAPLGLLTGGRATTQKPLPMPSGFW